MNGTIVRSELFSIGHSNHPIEKFLDLLRAHRIEVLADVRSKPYSRFSPQYNRPHLTAMVGDAAFKYLFLGKELGGRPKGGEFYDAEGHVLYSRLSESPLYRAGLERLCNGMQRYRIAIMCSEEDPAVCHRQLLIARVLLDRGVTVHNIRGDGRLESIAPGSIAHEALVPSVQLTMFGDAEVESWRSIRSVSPKNPLPLSSRSFEDLEFGD